VAAGILLNISRQAGDGASREAEHPSDDASGATASAPPVQSAAFAVDGEV
jgi:hypothetical protein